MATSNKLQSERLQTILVSSLCPDASGNCWKIKQLETIVNEVDKFDQIIVYLFDTTGLFMYYIIDLDGNSERRYTDVL